MRTDLILLDLDETLLNDEKKISKKDKKTLWDMSDAGVYIGYVTSRTLHRIDELLLTSPCDCLALYNGAAIIINRTNGVKERFFYGIEGTLAVEVLEGIYRHARFEVSAYFEDYSIWNGQVSRNGEEIGPFEACKAILGECKCQRIRIYRAKGQIEVLNNAMLHEYYEKNDILIEAADLDKGVATKNVCNLLGIKVQNVIAFGDSDYDIPMLKVAGIGVAMGNASNNLKNTADEVTLDNNSSGVGEYLNKKYSLKNHIVNATFTPEQCIYLLKNTSVEYREHKVNDDLLVLFKQEAENNAHNIARYVGILSEKLLSDVGEYPILVSLARGGIMPGALCKRYYEKIYGVKVAHYAISLVRGKGIDSNALDSIVAHHGDQRIRFIDGWTGSGLISAELEKYIDIYNRENNTCICNRLNAVSDSSRVCNISGTRDDVLLPDCCLNATICGLLSSINYEDGNRIDYHGATICENLAETDQTKWYFELVSDKFEPVQIDKVCEEKEFYGSKMQNMIVDKFKLTSVRQVRLGIGETTRALYRSSISCILIRDTSDDRVSFIKELAEIKKIRLIHYDTGEYRCIAILKD